jgi:hypothetical protein
MTPHVVDRMFNFRSWVLRLIIVSFTVIVTDALTFNSTVLVIGTDAASANKASYLLDGYGIGYETLVLGEENTPLPSLESSFGGNYGLVVVVAQAIVNDTSRLTDAQWETLWAYQRKFSVRMIHMDVGPSTEFGVLAVDNDGCCDDGIEQNVTLIEEIATKEFPNAGLK